MKIDKRLIINENDSLNTMRDKVHQNAINHDWADHKRSISEYCALFHSEVSEILEEFRMAKPRELWFESGGIDIIDTDIIEDVIEEFNSNEFENISKNKPCGYGIEFADLVIRVLDFCGENDLFLTHKSVIRLVIKEDIENLFVSICALHNRITNLQFAYIKKESAIAMFAYSILNYCFEWAKELNINLNKMIEIKHKYNLTRPKKHGKRF